MVSGSVFPGVSPSFSATSASAPAQIAQTQSAGLQQCHCEDDGDSQGSESGGQPPQGGQSVPQLFQQIMQLMMMVIQQFMGGASGGTQPQTGTQPGNDPSTQPGSGTQTQSGTQPGSDPSTQGDNTGGTQTTTNTGGTQPTDNTGGTQPTDNNGGTQNADNNDCGCHTPTEEDVANQRDQGYNGGDSGRTWGDPHLVGFDGEKYDVMGQPGKTYNMLSDKGVQYNAEFDKWGNDGATIIGKVGLQVGDSKIEYNRNGSAPTVNGQPLKKGQTVQLDDGGSATWDGNKLSVKTQEYTFAFSTVDDPKGDYINSDVKINGNPFADGVKPHGLLGQTADGVQGAHVGDGGKDQGKQGGTVIDGTVADYQTNGLFGNNFKYNRFGAVSGPQPPADPNASSGGSAAAA